MQWYNKKNINSKIYKQKIYVVIIKKYEYININKHVWNE